MNEEKATEFIRRSINVLFVANPAGTSVGVFIGIVLDGVFGFISPLFKGIEIFNSSAVKVWHFIGLGVVLMNLPTYLRRKEIDPSILNAIKYIEEQKEKGRISEWQAKQMYVNLHQKVLESVTLNDAANEKLNMLAADSKRNED